MSDTKSKEILKGAILLEQKGKAFYENVAKMTDSAAVREVFTSMAMEEIKHTEILLDQYESLVKTGRMKDMAFPEQAPEFHQKILTEKIKNEINGAGYEAAAITAALAMEQSAVKFYGDRAVNAEDESEKKLYKWLEEWEKTHVELLVEIDNELREKIWYDQHFWPVL